jgi:hypothetical protein
MVKISGEYAHLDKRVVKLLPFVESGGGGIFRSKARKRLVGLLPVSGRNRTKNQFWYDQRERVKRALMDLELFILCAEPASKEQVINDETIKPILQALLDSSQDTEFNKIKAEIAYNMVYLGFSYLRDIEYEDLTLSYERTIEEAIDLADYLSKIIPVSE